MTAEENPLKVYQFGLPYDFGLLLMERLHAGVKFKIEGRERTVLRCKISPKPDGIAVMEVTAKEMA